MKVDSILSFPVVAAGTSPGVVCHLAAQSARASGALHPVGDTDSLGLGNVTSGYRTLALGFFAFGLRMFCLALWQLCLRFWSWCLHGQGEPQHPTQKKTVQINQKEIMIQSFVC